MILENYVRSFFKNTQLLPKLTNLETTNKKSRSENIHSDTNYKIELKKQQQVSS